MTTESDVKFDSLFAIFSVPRRIRLETAKWGKGLFSKVTFTKCRLVYCRDFILLPVKGKFVLFITTTFPKA